MVRDWLDSHVPSCEGLRRGLVSQSDGKMAELLVTEKRQSRHRHVEGLLFLSVNCFRAYHFGGFHLWACFLKSSA